MNKASVFWILLSITVVSCTGRIDRKAGRILSRMTLEEKIGMVHSNRMFSSGGVDRLGVPDLWFTDGPHGVRWESVDNGWAPVGWSNDACSNFPALGALAATWNRDLARKYGEALGEECRARGKHVSLAPGVNINRSPLNGRVWEYFSEDPYVTSEMAVPYIQGVQSKGVASCVKHFALNSQAWHQYTTSSEVDERTLREIYLPAFEAAIKKGGAMAVMPAYNKVRGKWCSENSYLIDTVLRKEWGFDGLVVSDWNGVHSTVDAAKCGIDVEMGTAIKKDGKYDFDNYYFANPLLEAVKKGEVSEETIDRKVLDILRLMLRLDIVGKSPYDTTGMASKLACPEHAAVAREVAAESVVLLKNTENRLPVRMDGVRKVAVIGANASTQFSLGGGSTKVKAKYEVTPLEGIRNALGAGVEVLYAPGYKLLNRQYVAALHRFTDEFDRNWPDLEDEAVSAASESDLVIYVGGLNHEHGSDCEGFDRPSLSLPYRQDMLIGRILEANPNTVVVLMAGSPVRIGEWFENAGAVLQTSFLGMEAGNALADVIFGKTCPSGKLTNTWPKSLSDSPDHAIGDYPGEDETVTFREGMMVGYRYFDSSEVQPQFEFGYGLSYTTFEYSDLVVESPFKVSLSITNTGDFDGAECVQAYVSRQSSGVRYPEKELRGFSKVFLKKGETERISIDLDERSYQYYDVAGKGWKADPDSRCKLLVGSSSRDIRLSAPLKDSLK